MYVPAYARRYTDEYYGFAETVRRGTMLGLPAGAISGAVAGTLVFPLVGTLFGTFIGAISGVLLALPCALVLGLLSWARPTVGLTRLVSVVSALGLGTVPVIRFGFIDSEVLTAGAYSLAAISAAVVGPRAVHRRDRPELLPTTAPHHAAR